MGIVVYFLKPETVEELGIEDLIEEVIIDGRTYAFITCDMEPNTVGEDNLETVLEQNIDLLEAARKEKLPIKVDVNELAEQIRKKSVGKIEIYF